MTDRIELLWIDLRLREDAASAYDQLNEYFEIRRCALESNVSAEVVASSPDALLLDFDFPDRAGLHLLQDLKARYSCYPIIMSTMQHSEDLAVWAFRSGVLDFLVKPIVRADALRIRNRLGVIKQAKRRQRSRTESHDPVELPAEAAPVQSVKSRSLAPAIQYIASYFHQKIGREQAAQLCSMSPFRFSREFKEVYGVSFSDYVVRYRLREACRLLERPGAAVTEVALAVGFQDSAYFSRVFKQHTGISPSEQKAAYGRSAAARRQTSAPVDIGAEQLRSELMLPLPDRSL